MATTLYWIIIAIVLANFLLGVWLQVLSIRASRNPIPPVLAGLYDDEKYAKQQSYFRINHKVAFISSSVSALITLAFFAFGGYGWLDGVARGISARPVLQALCFFGFIYVVTFLISLPFSIYETFVIEERFGFNKTTPKVFAGDTVKSFLIEALINGGLLAICVWIYTLTPKWFWLIAFGVFAAFLLFFQYFYSELIVPLFNKQKPLEEGELRSAIEAFADKAGSYYRHQSSKFVSTWDAYSYLYVCDEVDSNNVGRGRGGVEKVLGQIKADCTFVCMSSDELFPPEDMKPWSEMVPGAKFHLVRTPYGHDGFLIETDAIGDILRPGVERLLSGD